jgi:hypothetical protein
LFLVRRDSTWIDAADLFVAADHRIELALARELGEVAAVALERLVGAFGFSFVDALRAAAHRGQRLQDLSRDAVLREQLRAGERPPSSAIAMTGVGADELVLQRGRLRPAPGR